MKRIILLFGALLLSFAMRAQSVSYTCRYWFDQNHAQTATTAFSNATWQAELDVGSLPEGLHTLHLQFADTSMRWNAPESFLFLKTQENPSENLTYHCWFDQNFEDQQTGMFGNGHFLLNLGELDDGLHIVNVALQDDFGTLTTTQSYMFMKVTVNDPFAELQYHCWFDEDYSTVQTGPLGNGLFELEVGNLANGIHTVNVQLDNGMRIPPQCYLFYKQPLGGYGIARWEYWLNDDIANRQITNISPTVDTLDIISLLPVGHPAIRSSCFHFHPNGDAPYINAKNQINFRFWDSEMHFIDKSAFYVDEQVEQDIVATVFERDTTETFAAPRDNQITWYKLDAGVGDSLAFKADKACTMQLFAPSGEEVYSATASEAMVFGGCHAWEDGTYYLAVHDVTGSGEMIDVTYNHLDRYVILSCSPESVGNAVGYSFSFYYIGNGLESIENIYLTHGGDTLTMDTIPYSTMSQSYAMFNIVNAIPNGVYDATFVFSDGADIEVVEYANALTLEEPIYGDIVVSYNTPSQMARPLSVTITFENTGNIDYSYIPYNLAVDNVDKIESINFDNFVIAVSEDAIDSINSVYTVTDNLFDNHIDGSVFFGMIPSLRAHEKLNYSVSFEAPNNTQFNLWAWTDLSLEQEILNNPDSIISFCQRDLNTLNAAELLGMSPNQVKTILPNPYRESLDSDFGLLDKGKRVVKIIQRINFNNSNAYQGVFGVTQGMVLNPGGLTHFTSGNNVWFGTPTPTMVSIAPGFFVVNYFNLYPYYGWNWYKYDIRVHHAPSKTLPLPGISHHVRFVNPNDPNDIHGYLSESCSYYMRQEIQNVQYEIEFENDTTLATAAAHTIIVRDTLDASKFDLNSLAARSVTIGDKRLDLNGEQTFARTLDLRPELYVIAQVEQDYDPTTGIIQWMIQSLDPMTMEPTDDPNQGVLPVNYYGNGVGFIDYSINLKQAFADGTEISNRAGIIFDQEEVIMTPTWTNIIDAVKPTSYIEEVTFEDDTLNFSFISSDNRSGVWYHSLYYRNDFTDMEWKVKVPKILENNYLLYFDEYQTTEYLVMAIDSAGNHEEKDMVAEYIHYYDGPTPVCQTVALSQGWNWFSTYIEAEDPVALFDMLKAALGNNGLQIESANSGGTLYLGDGEWFGDLDCEGIYNEQMYLIEVAAGCTIHLQGIPANPAEHQITIYPGWNWIGFPSSVEIPIAETFAGFQPEEEDLIESILEESIYIDGEWIGSGFEALVPGQGFMYYSNSTETKTLVFPVNKK